MQITLLLQEVEVAVDLQHVVEASDMLKRFSLESFSILIKSNI